MALWMSRIGSTARIGTCSFLMAQSLSSTSYYPSQAFPKLTKFTLLQHRLWDCPLSCTCLLPRLKSHRNTNSCSIFIAQYSTQHIGAMTCLLNQTKIEWLVGIFWYVGQRIVSSGTLSQEDSREYYFSYIFNLFPFSLRNSQGPFTLGQREEQEKVKLMYHERKRGITWEQKGTSNRGIGRQ